MIYSTSITTAAKGTEKNATRTTIKITKGLIWLMEIDFPAGCVGLVHAQLFDGKYQLLPASPGKNLSGDGQLLRYDDSYLKEAAPFELTLVSWNEDELWTHNIQVRIGVASSRLFMARYLPSVGWEDFAKEMEKARAGQRALMVSQTKALLKEIEQPEDGDK